MSECLVSRFCTFVLLTLPFFTGSFSRLDAQASGSERLFAGYFEEWGIPYTNFNISNLEKAGIAGRLNYLIYAFGNVTSGADPKCTIADPVAAYQNESVPSVNGKPYATSLRGNFGGIQQLKELHPRLKVLISLGGQLGSSAGWETASRTAEGRAVLVSSCVDLFVKGNIAPGIQAPGLFDGFNIDWEFPGGADKQNFTALLAEFRAQLRALSKSTGKRYILSFDSPASPQKYANIDLKAAAEQVDFLTIDGYDYAGDSDRQTNEQSPLYEGVGNPLRDQASSIDETVTAYLNAGVPPEKYTMGFPLYAVGWTGVANANHGLYEKVGAPSPVLLADGSGPCPNPDKAAPAPGCDTLLTPGYLTYATIEKLIGRFGYEEWYDAVRVEATLYNPATGTFYSYDDPKSVAAKTAYIRRRHLGGAYVWALNQDDAEGSLTKTIADGLK